MKTGNETGLKSGQVYNTWKKTMQEDGSTQDAKFVKCGFCKGLGYRRSRLEKKIPEECPKCKGWGMYKDA